MKRFLFGCDEGDGQCWLRLGRSDGLGPTFEGTKVRVVINDTGVGSVDISGTSVMAAARYRVGEQGGRALERNDGEGITAQDPTVVFRPPDDSRFRCGLPGATDVGVLGCSRHAPRYHARGGRSWVQLCLAPATSHQLALLAGLGCGMPGSLIIQSRLAFYVWTCLS